MDTPPKFTDLPNKLLGLIFNYLDSDSLFSLSMTCRVLHYVALPAFFEQNDVKELASGRVFLYRPPRKMLQALRMALFVEKLDQIHYYCPNSINSSVTRHRGSEIDEILTGHRSQGPATKSPGQSKNWVLFPLEIDFFSS